MSRDWRRNSGKAFTGTTGRGYNRSQEPARHGTQSGYVLHRAFSEDACAECKAAHTAYSAAQRTRRKARAAGEPPPDLPRSNEVAS
jgi:hypothetical protein